MINLSTFLGEDHNIDHAAPAVEPDVVLPDLI